MKSPAAREFVRQFLLANPINVLESRIKQAAIDKFLISPRVWDYHSMALDKDFITFVHTIRQVFADHRQNSENLCEILVRNPNPNNSELQLMLTTTLEIDAALMGYTFCLKDQFKKPGRYTALKIRAERTILEAEHENSQTQTLFTPYYFDSFPFMLARDIIQLLQGQIQITEFAGIYTHGLAEIAKQVIEEYLWLDENSFKELTYNRHLSRQQYREFRSSIIAKTTSQDFEDLEIEIQGLLYIDHYIEPKVRFALSDGIGDVILRHQVAARLNKADLLQKNDPFSVPQTYLLKLLEKIGGRYDT